MLYRTIPKNRDSLSILGFGCMRLASRGGRIDEETVTLASSCKECGQCEKACPQNLPIRELLKDVSREFEGPLARPPAWVGKQFVAMQGRGTMRRASGRIG